jgi:hypothetical protein
MSPTERELPDPSELRRDVRFVAVTIVLMLALNVPAAIFHLGWKSAVFNTGLTLLVYVAYVLRYRCNHLLAWLVFGLAAGFTELLADAWLVRVTGSLVYAPDEPMIVASPAYMPFAWAVILLQMAAIATWLRSRMPVPLAAVVTGLFCGVNIPLYEHLAKDANWWFYQGTPMLGGAPYYIIVGEFLLGLPLVWMATRLLRGRPVATGLVLGVIQGLVIFVAYVVAWWLVGPCGGGVLAVPCG